MVPLNRFLKWPWWVKVFVLGAVIALILFFATDKGKAALEYSDKAAAQAVSKK